MASRVERADAVGGTIAVTQADEPRSGSPSGAAGVVVLPPAQLITQAQENLGLDLSPPGKRINRSNGAVGRQAAVQNVLGDLVGVPLSSVRPSRDAGSTSDNARRYFFERRDAIATAFMREYGFSREQAQAAANQWVGRNVARWEYQRREHRGDGLRALTTTGMLIAIANASDGVDPALVAAARIRNAELRDRLITASTTPGSDPDEVARQIDDYLSKLGSRVNTSTAGWDKQVEALEQADYYRPFNPPGPSQQGEVLPFNPPRYVAPQRAEVSPLGEQAHSDAMRRANRAATAEHSVRVAQRERDDLRAHLANLEAQGRRVGGPTLG